LAFGALIANWRPDLIDFDSLDPSQPAKTLSIVFSARDRLGIMSLLDAADIENFQDDKSIQTQLFEFYKVLSKLSPVGYRNCLLDAGAPTAVTLSASPVKSSLAAEASDKRAVEEKRVFDSKRVADENHAVGEQCAAVAPLAQSGSRQVFDHAGNQLFGFDADLFLKLESKVNQVFARHQSSSLPSPTIS
jgi:hypothetical protein